mmetsp:Transcript_24700/g.71311  ORF Transcript_24700/g.71311 Transcript_24700/m.71311 type:complete len:200 (+) Transcript_24700:227-826(+)
MRLRHLPVGALPVRHPLAARRPRLLLQVRIPAADMGRRDLEGMWRRHASGQRGAKLGVGRGRVRVEGRASDAPTGGRPRHGWWWWPGWEVRDEWVRRGAVGDAALVRDGLMSTNTTSRRRHMLRCASGRHPTCSNIGVHHRRRGALTNRVRQRRHERGRCLRWRLRHATPLLDSLLGHLVPLSRHLAALLTGLVVDRGR